MREVVDFVFNLHGNENCIDLDKYSKLREVLVFVKIVEDIIYKVQEKRFIVSYSI